MNGKIATLLIFAAFLVAAPSLGAAGVPVSASKQPRVLHYTDTVRSPNKQAQFLKAIELAPTVWEYDEIIWTDENTVTIKGMRFNASMDKTLDSILVTEDPGLAKRLRRVNSVTKPLNGVVDLTVSYKKVPSGIAVDYLITGIKLFSGGK